MRLLHLARVAATMVLAGHIEEDLGCARHCTSLLTNDITMFVPTLQDTTNAQGCYLHHHKNGAVWERSGNAVGQSLLDRTKQHATSAQRDLLTWPRISTCHFLPKPRHTAMPEGEDSSVSWSSIVALPFYLQEICTFMR